MNKDPVKLSLGRPRCKHTTISIHPVPTDVLGDTQRDHLNDGRRDLRRRKRAGAAFDQIDAVLRRLGPLLIAGHEALAVDGADRAESDASTTQ